jgi:hypothetical protein
LAQFSAEFFADKVCLQDLSAFSPGFGGFSADKVCLQDLSVRVSCADKLCLQKLLTKFVCRVVCQGFLCRQTLSAETADKLCLQNLLTKFVCRTAADKPCLRAHQFVCNIHQMTNFVYSRQTFFCSMTNFVYRGFLFESGPGPEGGGYLRAAQRP